MKVAQKTSKYTCYGVLAVVIAALAYLNAFYLENWLDSDMAAEMIFAKHLAKEGSFIASSTWSYSTEFRVLYTQLVMTPLFLLMDNWHVIRMITNLVFYALLLGSYFFMCKPLPAKKEKKVLCGAFLLLPFSETLMLHMEMGNTYLSHVIILFFLMGFVLRLLEKRSVVWMALYILLSVICGISGIRYMLAFFCPLMLGCVVYICRSSAFASLRKEPSCAHFRALWEDKTKLNYVLTSGIGLVSAGVGYLVNVLYVTKQFSFQTYESTLFVSVYEGEFLSRVRDTFGSLLMLFGYIPEKSVLSLRGVISVGAFVLIGALVVVAVQLTKEKRSLPMALSSFFYASFGVNTFVFLFTNSTLVPRYYITTLVFMVPLCALYFSDDDNTFAQPLDRKLIGLLLIFFMVLGAGKSMLSMKSTDKNADKRVVAEYLQEQGYTFGYATYWNGNILQELTDGEVEVANIGRADQDTFFNWSSKSAYYDPSYHTGKVFLLLTRSEAEESFADFAMVKLGKKEYEDDAYVIYAYETNADFYKAVGKENK